jgi:predicted acetyltransferase
LFEDNSGCYALHIDGGAATCERGSAPADLAMSINELGSLYLGGVRASELARARRIRELSEGAVARADSIFSGEPQPWSATWF